MIELNGRKYFTGWKGRSPDDERDYNEEHPKVKGIIEDIFRLFFKHKQPYEDELPKKVDWPQYYPIHRYQDNAGTCISHAAPFLFETLQNVKFGYSTQYSRLAHYLMTRFLMEGRYSLKDEGSFIRYGIQALRRFGIPEEKYWPYKDTEVTKMPKAEDLVAWLCLADDNRLVKTICLDRPQDNKKPEQIIFDMKKYVSVKRPYMFGVYLGDALEHQVVEGDIPLPSGDSLYNGHALFGMGYNTERIIKGRYGNVTKTFKGAFKVLNSWRNWGFDDFGWIPFDYIRCGKLCDIWVGLDILAENTKEFERS